jgi:hypothetical protein
MVQASRAREALEYFEKLEETFSTQGWKLLIEEARAQLYQYQADVLEVDSWEKVCELRGQVQQLSRLINLEEVTGLMRQQAEDRLLEEASEDADL